MKSKWLNLILAFTIIFPINAAGSQETFRPFVVVELFTSQGCSSCPTADIILSKLIATARQKDLPIYPLSFHVDYWNRLGWRDPFSSRIFSDRQNEYAQILKSDIYTPQMVVNGVEAFNGNDQEKLEGVLNAQLGEAVFANVELKLLARNANWARIKYDIVGDFGKNDQICFALVERSIKMNVQSGENAGRTLKHDNVVKEFLVSIVSEGEVHVPLKKIRDVSQASLIAFVQDSQTLLIKSASQVRLE